MEVWRQVCIIAGAVAGYFAVMWPLMSLVRKAKSRTFFKNSLCALLVRLIRKLCKMLVRLGRKIKLFFINLLDLRPFEKYFFAKALFKRQRLFIILSAINVFAFALFILIFFPISILIMLFELFLVYRFLKDNNIIFQDMGKIIDHIGEIEQGNLEYRTDISLNSPMRPCDEKLNNIGGGMQRSVEKQMGSERTKIELVTNVSHDLKTPLTSIIGYINLLQKEEMSAEARDYVEVLAMKSEKLKSIVSDVFELAKSTGGNLEMTSETLDFKRLVEQNLADMGDKIEKTSLGVRTKLPEVAVMINADGRRLTRVLQNILDNALNYSLAGSRIYVTLTENGVLTVKNTAAYEMEFTEDEILERFVRGDKSRTDGGSGLGLSIAQSFTAACGGDFRVSIDGDQFKVIIAFSVVAPAYSGEPVVEIVPEIVEQPEEPEIAEPEIVQTIEEIMEEEPI